MNKINENNYKLKLKDLQCINDNINVDKYIEARTKVKENMKYPEWLGAFSKEEIKFMLKNNSKIWTYYYNDELICSMMIIPSTKESLQKFELNLNNDEVIDYGPMFVNYKYIGNDLQYQMLQELDEYCMNLGYKYAIGTIHPDNLYSINNLLKDNFELKKQKQFTRGLRNIYLKELNS